MSASSSVRNSLLLFTQQELNNIISSLRAAPCSRRGFVVDWNKWHFPTTRRSLQIAAEIRRQQLSQIIGIHSCKYCIILKINVFFLSLSSLGHFFVDCWFQTGVSRVSGCSLIHCLLFLIVAEILLLLPWRRHLVSFKFTLHHICSFKFGAGWLFPPLAFAGLFSKTKQKNRKLKSCVRGAF